MKIESNMQMVVQSTDTNHKSTANQEFRRDILVTAKGGGISFIGRIFEYLVRFVFSIVVARGLGAEQFGLYTLGLTLVQIISMLALLGLQTGLVRYLAPAIRQKDDTQAWGIIQVSLGLPALLSIIFASCLYLLAGQVAENVFRDPRLIPIIRLVSICIPLDAVSFIQYAIALTFKQPKYVVIASDIVAPLSKLLLTILFLALGWGTLGTITAHVTASAVGLVVITFYVNLLFPLKRSLSNSKRNVKELLKYSMPVHVGWMFTTVRGTLETLILGLVGLTTGVGIYSVALRLAAIGSMLFLSIGNISTPIIADLHSRGERAQLRSFYQTTTKWILMFNFPLFLTFTIFAGPILSIFGADFTNGAQGLMILSLGNLFYTGTGLGANILDMTDHTRINSANSAFMVVITIVLDLLLIPRWGVLGAAAASAFSTVVVNLVCMIEVLVLLKIQPYKRDILKPLVAGFITAGFTLLIKPFLAFPSLLVLLIGSIILWGIYTLIMILLKFSEEDLMVFTSIHSRIKLLLPQRTPIVS